MAIHRPRGPFPLGVERLSHPEGVRPSSPVRRLSCCRQVRSFSIRRIAPTKLWQTDFTHLHVVSWGWYHLSTVLDDYSRYILAWTLRTSMAATDVMETLDLARAAAGIEHVPVVHRPRLLSDNGPCYISGELAAYLETHGLPHTRSAPYHPMTQGKIERYHRSLKNVVKLEPYYGPGRWNGRSPASWRTTITGAITSRCRT
jgi:transposase InsO family protein